MYPVMKSIEWLWHGYNCWSSRNAYNSKNAENILLRACQQTIPGKVLNKQANDASFNRDIGVYCGGRPLLTFQA